jgi:hypothetical protein
MRACPVPPFLVATWAGGVDKQKLVSADEDFPHLHRTFAGKAFDEDVDELILVMVVEHVGEAVRGELHDSRQDTVLAVGDELDLLARAGRVAWRSRHGRDHGGSAAEHDAEAATDALDHGSILAAMTARA